MFAYVVRVEVYLLPGLRFTSMNESLRWFPLFLLAYLSVIFRDERSLIRAM